MDTRIFCITHKKFTKPDMQFYIPLHVGREISDDLGYLADNTGDNISNKNKTYCELTGMYWIWKNVTCDVVGICHYRRYFMKNENFLSKEYIEDCLKNKGYDLIVSNSGTTAFSSVREHYAKEHYEKDFDICRTQLALMYPEYLDAFDLAAECNFMTLGNMVITKKDIYDRYCEWLFPLLFEIERNTDITEYDTFQARIYGYLAERLFRVWIMNNNLNVKEEEVKLIDPDEMYSGMKNISRLLELKMMDFINLCKVDVKAELWTDAMDKLSLESGVLPVDFNNKIPVFSCWWQGYDNAPYVVKKCLQSIDNVLPSDLTEFHIITLENVSNYVAFPDWVIKKFNDGEISMAHLTDILKLALLNKYGGMWIDANYYAVRNFDDGLLDKDILDTEFMYTIKNQSEESNRNITMGRWCQDLLFASKGNLAVRLAANFLYEYWRVNDKICDVYLADYIFDLIYKLFPDVQKLMDSVPHNNQNYLKLENKLNFKFDQRLLHELSKDTFVFKINIEQALTEETLLKDKTFYGYFMNDMKI